MARRRKAERVRTFHVVEGGAGAIRVAYEQCRELGIVAQEVRVIAIPSPGDDEYVAYVADLVGKNR